MLLKSFDEFKNSKTRVWDGLLKILNLMSKRHLIYEKTLYVKMLIVVSRKSYSAYSNEIFLECLIKL